MIQDANDFPEATDVVTECCVVGAGPAGISLALRLAERGVQVLLLESGGLRPEAQTQRLYEGSVEDEHLHSPLDTYRVRAFGGSSSVWGGRCMPMDPIDFEQRDYVANSGWPIDEKTLAPFYRRAIELCEAEPFEFTAEEAFHRPTRPMIEGFQGRNFTTNTLERFSRPTDFGRQYAERLRESTRVRVVLYANVTDLKLTPDGRSLQTVVARTLRGRTLSVRASQFVLATGGLEVTRLLLANRQVHANGIGNSSGVLGRFYMCHLAGTIGAVSLRSGANRAWHGYDRSDRGVYCRRRLALRATVQRAERIGNFIARLHHPRITNPEHGSSILSLLYLAKPLVPYEYRKRLHGDGPESLRLWLRHVGNVARSPFDAVAFSWHLLKDRRLASRKFPSIIITPKSNLFSIDFHAEQFPNAASRVTLSGQSDVLGMPKLHVDWRYTSGDVATVVKALSLLAEDIASGGVGKFEFDPASVEAEMIRYGAYGGHHIGTARMGSDPRRSVVDADCRVHEVGNLYLASAAVFPTSSQANPTLTVVALALRLADHLASQVAAERLPAPASGAGRSGSQAGGESEVVVGAGDEVDANDRLVKGI